jgi:iron(III) transport system ATP-binding protein
MGIHIQNLSVAYGPQRVIDGLNLSVAPGAFFTLLGPSGCGKTTLLRTIAGFIPVQEGSLRFGDRDVTALQAHQRDIGMVFQDYALFPNRTVFENVAYGLRARNTQEAAIRTKVNAALERVGLAPFGERHPAALSGGQRQRVALARALVIQPRVLLMDEPLSNLDAKLRIQVRETIAELQREAGITTIFVTHDQDEALALSDSIAVMNKGKIEQLGTPTEIYQRPASSYVADFVGAANVVPIEASAVRLQGEHAVVQLAGGQVQARVPAPLTQAQAMLVARPEDITLAQTGGLAGRIRSQQYLGVKTSYRVELANGTSLTVEQHGSSRASLANGSDVALVFDANKTLVLPT